MFSRQIHRMRMAAQVQHCAAATAYPPIASVPGGCRRRRPWATCGLLPREAAYCVGLDSEPIRAFLDKKDQRKKTKTSRGTY